MGWTPSDTKNIISDTLYIISLEDNYKTIYDSNCTMESMLEVNSTYKNTNSQVSALKIYIYFTLMGDIWNDTKTTSVHILN